MCAERCPPQQATPAAVRTLHGVPPPLLAIPGAAILPSLQAMRVRACVLAQVNQSCRSWPRWAGWAWHGMACHGTSTRRRATHIVRLLDEAAIVKRVQQVLGAATCSRCAGGACICMGHDGSQHGVRSHSTSSQQRRARMFMNSDKHWRSAIPPTTCCNAFVAVCEWGVSAPFHCQNPKQPS